MPTPRLFIIDPYLKSSLGHPFEQARLHAAMAMKDGYQPCLVFDNSVDLSEEVVDWPVQNLYASDSSGTNLEMSHSITIQNVSLQERQRGLTYKFPNWVGASIRRASAFFFGVSAQERNMILEAQWFGTRFSFWLHGQSFNSKDVVFCPTLSWAEAALASEIFQDFLSTKRVKDIYATFMLRFDPPRGLIGRRYLQRAGQRNSGIAWVSDTRGLADKHQKIMGCQVRCVNVPVDTLQAQEFGARPETHYTSAVFMGESRLEKGFHLLPEAIAIVRQSSLQRPIKFYIQIAPIGTESSVLISKTIDKLRGMRADDLVIIDGALSSLDFHKLVQSADIALAPYDPAQYRWRSSGFVATCLTGRAIIVARAGKSWISETISSADLIDRAVFFKTFNARAFAEAIIVASLKRRPRPIDPNVLKAKRPWPQL
jgi:glycosyltransferase involved in cell wall biosynthesis